MNAELTFYICWICLLGSPPLAIVSFFAIRKKFPNFQFRLILFCAILVLSMVVSSVGDISFTSLAANVMVLAISYLAYCYLAVSSWQLGSKLVRLLVLAIASLPILFGYMLGTVGLLALMFIIGDYADPPLKEDHLESNLRCEVRSWGMAASDSGYTIHLYKVWFLVPFLKKEVSKIVVNETHPREGLEKSSCQDALSAYMGKGT